MGSVSGYSSEQARGAVEGSDLRQPRKGLPRFVRPSQTTRIAIINRIGDRDPVALNRQHILGRASALNVPRRRSAPSTSSIFPSRGYAKLGAGASIPKELSSVKKPTRFRPAVRRIKIFATDVQQRDRSHKA